jgi:hypothetical protein
MIKRNLLIGNF